MKSCKDLQEKLLSYMKREETAPFKREVIENHLQKCKSCREELKILENTDLLLETARLPFQKKAPDRILSRVTQQPKKSTRRVVVSQKLRHRWPMPMAAAILFGLVLYFALRPADPARATLTLEDSTVLLSVESGKIDLETLDGRKILAQGETSRIQKLPAQPEPIQATKVSRVEEDAWASYAQGSYQKALEAFRLALDLRKNETPRNNTALGSIRTGMGWGLYFGQQYEEAILEFKSALEKIPASADAQRGLGYCHFRLGEYDLAVSILKPVGEAVPKWIDVQLTLGWAEYWQEDYTNAISYFRSAKLLNPFLAEPSIGLGWSYYKSDQPETARTVFANALTLYPDYFQNKDFQSLLSYRSDWLSLQLSVAWAYYNKMNYDRAEESFLSFLEKLGKERNIALVANTRCGLGWTLYKKGQRTEAEEQFDLALKIAPSDSNALLGKQLCMQTGSIPKEN